MLGNFVSILIVSLFCAVVMVAEHYVPWARWLAGNKKPHPVWNYVQGLLGILISFTALAAYWHFVSVEISPLIMALAAWSISTAAGVSVLACYWIDSAYCYRARAREAEEREVLARQQLEKAL